MRHKIATVAAGAAIGLAGVTLAGPALAAVGATGTAAAVDSRVAKIKAALSGLVTDKTLTQAQADKVAQTLGSTPLGGGGFGGRGGPGGHDGFGGFGGRHGGGPVDLATAATALGMSQTDLQTALRGGSSLADVAKTKNVSVDDLIAKLVAAAKTKIDAQVTAGNLTQAQADSRLADLKAHITEEVNEVHTGMPGHDEMAPDPAPSTTPSAGTTTSSYTISA